MGTLLGNLLGTLLTCSWEPCLGTLPLPGNLAWEPVPGNVGWEAVAGNLCLGTCSWERCLGTCSWERCLGTCSWEPCLGTSSWEPCLGTSWEPCLPSWEPAWEPWAVRIWAAPPCSGTFSLWLKTQAYGLCCWGKTFHLVEETQSTLKTFFFPAVLFLIFNRFQKSAKLCKT